MQVNPIFWAILLGASGAPAVAQTNLIPASSNGDGWIERIPDPISRGGGNRTGLDRRRPCLCRDAPAPAGRCRISRRYSRARSAACRTKPAACGPCPRTRQWTCLSTGLCHGPVGMAAPVLELWIVMGLSFFRFWLWLWFGPTNLSSPPPLIRGQPLLPLQRKFQQCIFPAMRWSKCWQAMPPRSFCAQAPQRPSSAKTSLQ